MSNKLIAKTGQCRLKAYDWPVRIYATDCGQTGDMIHGAYQDKDGWHSHAWDADGSPRTGTTGNDRALVPILPPVYFNMCIDQNNGSRAIGTLYDTLTEARESWSYWEGYDVELFKRTGDKVELIARSITKR